MVEADELRAGDRPRGVNTSGTTAVLVDAGLGAKELRETVEAHAQARIDHDLARFASYMTPQALVILNRQSAGVPQSPSRFSVIDLTTNEERGRGAVRFDGGGSYVMESEWQRVGAGWTIVRADIDHASIRFPWWHRLMRRRRAPLPVERKELE